MRLLKHIGRRIFTFDELTSTNDHAAKLIDDPEAIGAVICARSQTAGRGTHGRSWHSPDNAGLWMSMILDPPAHLRRPAIMTAWVAVSLAEALRPMIGRQPRIKWPNDILIGRKKVAGILVEQSARTIVGIGLNLNQTEHDFIAAQLPDAASLAMITGKMFDVEQVLSSVLKSFDDEYDSLLKGELTTLEACWKWRIGLLGRHVEVECCDGRQIEGRLMEMAFNGVEIALPEGQTTRVQPEEIRHIVAR